MIKIRRTGENAYAVYQSENGVDTLIRGITEVNIKLVAAQVPEITFKVIDNVDLREVEFAENTTWWEKIAF